LKGKNDVLDEFEEKKKKRDETKKQKS